MKNKIRWIRRQYYKMFYYSPLWETVYGKFRVLYPDGERSVPMCWKNAKTYRDLFGGTIIDNF